jgi:outer membrane protein OmpA-like peptidoglycan-associated protein
VKVAATPVAPAPQIGPAEPVTPVATLPAQLSLSNESGVLHYAGSVHDEQTRASILDALKASFGADRISGEIGVDPLRASAAWLGNLRAALEQFKHPGLKAVFDGNSLNLGGIGEQDRSQILAALKSLFGNGLSFGWLTGNAASLTERASTANAKVSDSLASLKPGFGAQDLLGVINLSIITFPTAGYDLPAPELALLQKIAGLMRQLPAGTVLEIDGFTDNTGDEAANVVLSQHRADAVRNALVAAGVDASMLTAKGYGSSNPVDSNDSEEGRLHNRRIEYHVKP